MVLPEAEGRSALALYRHAFHSCLLCDHYGRLGCEIGETELECQTIDARVLMDVK